MSCKAKDSQFRISLYRKGAEAGDGSETAGDGEDERTRGPQTFHKENQTKDFFRHRQKLLQRLSLTIAKTQTRTSVKTLTST
jgi:hypothetical protein